MSEHELAIIFDGPPSQESGRFIEVELDGKGIAFGKWLEGAAGIWKLILPEPYARIAALEAILEALVERAERVQQGEEWDLAEFILRKAAVQK